MDTDLMTLWIHAEFLSKDEARDLITEVQRHRDYGPDAVRDIRKAFDELCEAGIDDISERVGKLGTVIEEWE